ncbi:carotenoid biosynthesis protein [Ferruginibacter lapsinanis]|uniref:carotenoid biosynthesis protein n=1 Tax=Ferruginibacter lapsinanis TaxID=563172 RepID=UPI001E34D64C|nr:carotenoid biosynthesis protein [Ferruginibacter lapsinanis]UEG50541.1 carotenoid biosynthesis protein [Ferruginibacter lapsinanis]
MINNFSKYQIATTLAIFFHTVGLMGILFFNKDFFIQATPFNLLLSAVLLFYTQAEKSRHFFVFATIVFFVGFTVEMIGVNTGKLFGQYNYGTMLGFKWKNVPVIIGLNWFIIIYCCGVCLNTFLMKIINRVAADNNETPKALKAMSVIVDGATLAVLFDWLMEPVAVKLGYWQWNNGEIPIYNYLCWFIISLCLLAVFHFSKFDKQNKFAVNLLLIQLMFFLILRTFLK